MYKLKDILESVLVRERMALKNYDEYAKIVAKAYDDAPVYDSSALTHWKTLNESNYKLFNMLLSRTSIKLVSENKSEEGNEFKISGKTYKVEYTDGEPYDSQLEMKQDWNKTKSIKISIDHSEHPVFSVEDNIVFRCVHDFIVHIEGNHPFGKKGEIASYNNHAKLVPRNALPAIFTEVVGQACYAVVNGRFPKQKIAVLKGFDYLNVGQVAGYDIKQKSLVKK